MLFGTSGKAANPTTYTDDQKEVALDASFILWPPLSDQSDDIIKDICQSVPLAHLVDCLGSHILAPPRVTVHQINWHRPLRSH